MVFLLIPWFGEGAGWSARRSPGASSDPPHLLGRRPQKVIGVKDSKIFILYCKIYTMYLELFIMSVCVCMYIHTYTHTYTHKCTCTCTCTGTCTCTCTYIYIYMYMYMYMYYHIPYPISKHRLCSVAYIFWFDHKHPSHHCPAMVHTILIVKNQRISVKQN